MEIKVFGPGCARCNQTEALIKEVISNKGSENITVQKVSDLQEMMKSGIMSTPAVMVDGIIKSTGKVPSKEEIAAWIDGNNATASMPQKGGCCCGGKC